MLFGDDNDSDLVLLGLKCLVMKMGLVMLEYHDLETHLDVRGAIGVIPLEPLEPLEYMLEYHDLENGVGYGFHRQLT